MEKTVNEFSIQFRKKTKPLELTRKRVFVISQCNGEIPNTVSAKQPLDFSLPLEMTDKVSCHCSR
jgi:hypothetical protein